MGSGWSLCDEGIAMRNRLLIMLLAVLALLGSACAGDVVDGEITDAGTAAMNTTAADQATDLTTEETSTTSVGGADSGDQSEDQSKVEDNAEPFEGSTTTTRATKEPERVPDDTTPPATGETPADLLAQIISDAADRASVDDSAVTVIRDEFAIWNDGSLGCPQPGQMYTQATVDGYWVVLRAADAEYDYRANTEGYWFLCEGGGLQPIPPSG